MKEPTQISWKELVGIFEDVRDLKSEQRFCFLLGAGASRSSDIPTGWELADKWYKRIKELLSEEELKQWKESIELDEARLGEFYTHIYERRFRASPETGYAEFKQLMDKKEPSIGYVILAQVLANEKHNFVITTNFDYLVEDAVRMYTATKPFSAGHETLAAYITTQTERPTIIKVHRDLFLHPFNDKKATDFLKQEWRDALLPVVRDFNLLVIGYGGNDGSLMDYLKEIKPDSRKPIYWCQRGKSELNKKVKDLLAEKDFIVNVEGFDELMYALYGALGYTTFEGLDSPNDHPFYQNAKKRVNDLNDKLKGLLEKSKRQNKNDSGTSSIKNIFKGPLEYVYAAQGEKDVDHAEKIYKEGLEKYPDDADLLGVYASFLRREKEDHVQAGIYYQKSLETNPANVTNLGNYANFLCDIKKDYAKAEVYYKKSLKVDPYHGINLGNYALFLHKEKKDYSQAKIYYIKSLEVSPNYDHVLGNYAHFLILTEKGFAQAKEYIDKAFTQNPKHLGLLSELWFYRYAHYEEHREEAEKELNRLIKEGAKSPGWDLQSHVDLAMENGHANPKLLQKFADQITKE